MMRVGLLGDSQGVGVERQLEVQLERQGHELAASKVQTGATLRVLAGLARELPAGLDVIVIVSGGGNDGSSVSSPARWLADVAALVTAVKARSPGAVVWAGPMPAREGVASAAYKLAARAGLPAALRGTGARWIDGFGLAEGVSPRADGLHFDGAGYRVIADRLAAALLAGGASAAHQGAPSVPLMIGALAGALVGVAALAYAYTRARA
jgi:lysophospholipase L1-like esterase